MKTQIWKTQFETYKLLINSDSGTFTQLNMGEGKTQVIIPMMVLNEVYKRKKFLPRVNILSPLYKEAQDNYYKFLSVTGFRINIIPIYFNRTVDVKQENINKMQYAIHLFRNKSLVMVDRDSRLSMILKIREEYGFKQSFSNKRDDIKVDTQCNKNDRWFFRNLPVFDVFDEVDALMTVKKSFVYAVGASSSLPTQLLRFEYSKVMLEIVVKEMFPFLLEN
jgi:hypothetical protein